QSHARLKSSLVELNSGLRIGAMAGDQKLAGRKVEVRLAIGRFRNRRDQRPGEPQVHGQILGYAPIVLYKRAEHFPAAPGDGAVKGLIMYGEVRQTEQEG